MTAKVLYSDGPVTITDSSIVFQKYHLSGGEKEIPFHDIKEIRTKKPIIWNGKWRTWGTGDIKTWFPLDDDRPKRDRIFITRLNSQWVNIGFTVRDTLTVEHLLAEKNLPANE